MRINKFLSAMGICSRREADAMAAEGRIEINGIPAKPGSMVQEGDIVSVDGRTVSTEHKAKPVILAFNKPEGIVCSTSSSDGGPSIMEYFREYGTRVYPVGRLDRDSHGLILLTNRGETVNLINRSSGAHEKEYRVRCAASLSDSFIRNMARGVEISVPDGVSADGTRKYRRALTAGCSVRRLDEFTFDIVLTEGMNRQIRRMCEALGNRVTDLERVRIMNIRLGRLREGTYRRIKGAELAEFESMLGL